MKTNASVFSNTRRAVYALAAVSALAAAAFAAGCDDSTTPRETVPVTPGADAGRDTGATTTDGGISADGAPLDCFPNPTTHEEILNRCSTSEKIDKNPTLPLLLADGGLPALPP